MILATALLLGACATVDPKPFQEFNSATATARKGMEEITAPLMGLRLKVDEDALLDKNPEQLLLALQLRFDNDFSAHLEELPGPRPTEECYRQFQALNDKIGGYATVLQQLAEFQSSKEDRVKLSGEINGRLAGLSETLEAHAGEPVAIVSTAIAQLFDAYMKGVQLNALRQALEDNQRRVDDYARAVRVYLVADVLPEFRDNYRILFKKTFDAAKLQRSQPVAERRKALKLVLALNEQTAQQAAIMRSAYHFYGEFAEAHAALAKAVSNPGLSWKALLALHERAMEIMDQVQVLKTKNE